MQERNTHASHQRLLPVAARQTVADGFERCQAHLCPTLNLRKKDAVCKRPPAGPSQHVTRLVATSTLAYHTRKKLLRTCKHQQWTLTKSLQKWRMEESGHEGEKEGDGCRKIEGDICGDDSSNPRRRPSAGGAASFK